MRLSPCPRTRIRLHRLGKLFLALSQVVVLVTEGAEESKLRNSNSKSKSIMRALQQRKDKFELFQGDDCMVPPGSRPRMVKQEMIIVEYHLSQVGMAVGRPGRVSGDSVLMLRRG